MATLKARIYNKFHTARFELGGRVRDMVTVQAVIETDEPSPRTFGPFERTFDRAVEQHVIDTWLDEERRALEGRV